MINTMIVCLGATATAGPFASEISLAKKVNAGYTCLNHSYHGVVSRW